MYSLLKIKNLFLCIYDFFPFGYDTWLLFHVCFDLRKIFGLKSIFVCVNSVLTDFIILSVQYYNIQIIE